MFDSGVQLANLIPANGKFQGRNLHCQGHRGRKPRLNLIPTKESCVVNSGGGGGYVVSATHGNTLFRLSF